MYEGRAHDAYGFHIVGRAECACGWRSEELPSTRQRQQAHHAHKMDILAGVALRILDQAEGNA